MSPTVAATLLLMALFVDYFSVGANAIRDKVAILLALPAIRAGFDGSPLDRWTMIRAVNGIDWLKAQLGTAAIAGSVTVLILSVLVGLLGLYVIGALLPAKAAGKLGRFASIKFPTSGLYRINWKLWILAFALGMMIDLPRGWVGTLERGAFDVLTTIVTPLPGNLFGVW